MQYLCLIYQRDDILRSLEPPERDELICASLAYIDELRESGHVVAANALEPVDAAMSLRVRGNSAYITDGPYAETNEHVGGYLLIEARDLNDAIRIATRFPLGRLGGIEVRPVANQIQQMVAAPMNALSASFGASPMLER